MKFLKLDIQYFASSASATNSSLKSSAGNKGTLKVNFKEADLTDSNKTNNTSTITATASFTQNTGSYSGYSAPYLRLYWYDDNEHKNGTELINENVTAISKGQTVTIDLTFTVKHKADGTLNGYAKAKWEYDGSGTLPCKTGYATTANTALTTIPRASKLGTLSNFTLDETITIPITKQYASFTDVLTISLNDTTIKTVDDISNGYQLTFTEEELKILYELMPNTEKALIKFTLTTMNNNAQVGYCWQSVWGIIPEDVKPSIANITVTEANADVSKNFNLFIKSKSKLNVKIEAEGIYGSTISSYFIKANGTTYSTSEFTTSELIDSGTQEVNVTITDSRGRTTTDKVEIEVVDYFSPKATGFSFERCNSNGILNDEGIYVKAFLNYEIAPIENLNTKKVTIQYLENESWTTLATLTDAYEGVSRNYLITNKTFDVDNNHQFNMIVEDAFSSDEHKAVVTSTYSLINFHKDGKAIGFGKVATREEGFQFGDNIYDQWDTKITNGVAVYGGDPDTTTETLIMTSTNSPTGLAMYFHTFFNSNKGENQNCGQIAIPYLGSGSMYYRWRFSGTWTAWKELADLSVIGELSELQTSIKTSIVNSINSLKDDLYYKSGDTYKTTQQAIYTGGTVTGSTKSLNFTITVPKSLKDVSSITINSMTLLVRTTAGAYLNNASGGIKYGSTSGITYNTYITSDNTILIQLVSDSAYTNVTNNTPVNVAVSNFDIAFE